MFIAKLDAAGAHVWSRQLGEPDEAQWGVGIGSDRLGNVLVSGGFAGSIDLGGGPLAPADGPAFVLKLDPAGSSLWSRQLAAPGVSLRASRRRRIASWWLEISRSPRAFRLQPRRSSAARRSS